MWSWWRWCWGGEKNDSSNLCAREHTFLNSRKKIKKLQDRKRSDRGFKKTYRHRNIDTDFFPPFTAGPMGRWICITFLKGNLKISTQNLSILHGFRSLQFPLWQLIQILMNAQKTHTHTQSCPSPDLINVKNCKYPKNPSQVKWTSAL